MKKFISLTLVLTVLTLFMGGCGSYSDYTTQVNTSNVQMMEIWKSTTIERTQENRSNMKAFSIAMSNAALTPDSGDDVAIAMSYAFMSQQKTMELPKLSRVERPNDFVDGIKASVPFLGTLAPWLGMAYMADKISENSGTHYAMGNDNNINSTIDGSYSPLTGAEGSTSFSPIIGSPTEIPTTP